MNNIIVEVTHVSYDDDGCETSQEENSETVTKSSENNEPINQASTLGNNEVNEKQSAVWTTGSTLTLLKAYEAKLEMLETPKKKTRIWAAISEYLKEQDIEVTPDQVRWKINALAKKYKQCIDNGEHSRFRYFKEMDNIYTQFNVECADYSVHNAERFERRRHARKRQLVNTSNEASLRSGSESKVMIELRKARLTNRIEAERSQSKINLEKQWLHYLTRQEEQKRWRDEIFERSLKLREEELELRKNELNMRESLEIRKLNQKEKDQEEMLETEREKCELLKRIFSQASDHYN